MSVEQDREKLLENLRSMFAVNGFMDTVRDISKVHPEKSRFGLSDFDEYFLTKVYPCLMHGLEDLAHEVEDWNEGRLDDTETKRFNPCFNLAQFLMRNNPLYLNNADQYKDNHILTREQKRRIIEEMKPKLMTKIEEKLKGKSYPIDQIVNIFIEVDELLNANGKLKSSYTKLPEAVKAREVSRTYEATQLFNDIIFFYLSDDSTTPEDLKKSLQASLK